MLKAILRSTPVQYFFAALIAAYMALVRHTTRWTIEGADAARDIWDGSTGVVWCYWHSRILGAHATWPTDRKPILMLISLSRDGGFVAKAAEMVGRNVVRGSSAKRTEDGVQDKGGLQAFRAMVGHARKGGCVGITPDGPKGPRMRVQLGAVRVAKSARVPLLPSTYAIKGAKYAQSWDRFVLPPLFSKGIIIFGAPIVVPPDADEATLDAICVTLENSLTGITQQADAWAGGPLIEPDAPLIDRNAD